MSEQKSENNTSTKRAQRSSRELEAGAPLQLFGIDYVGSVAQYFDPDPNVMRGDGLRQRWPPGSLEKICRARVRR